MNPDELRGIVTQTLLRGADPRGNFVSFPMMIDPDANKGRESHCVVGVRAWDGFEFSFLADLVDNLMLDSDDLAVYMIHFHDNRALIENAFRRGPLPNNDAELTAARDWTWAWQAAIASDSAEYDGPVDMSYHSSMVARRYLYDGFFILVLPVALDSGLIRYVRYW